MVRGYGEMEGSEWEEEEEDEMGMGMAAIGRIVNEGVEQLLKVVMGELCWDKTNLERQLQRLP